MKTIKVGLSRPVEFKLFAAGIQWILDTNFDHVYVKLFINELGRWVVFQASGLRVNAMDTSIFDSENTTVHEYDIEVTDEQYSSIMRFCYSELGKPYAVKNIFAILIYLITGKKWLKGDGKSAFICSEFAGYVLRMSDVFSMCNEDMNYLNPKDVYLLLNDRS